jgi:hypothetical protein
MLMTVLASLLRAGFTENLLECCTDQTAKLPYRGA